MIDGLQPAAMPAGKADSTVERSAQRIMFILSAFCSLFSLSSFNVILPIVGDVRAKNLSEVAIDSFRKGGIPVLTIASGIFGVGALGGAVWRWGDRAAVWLFAAGATLAVVSYSAALTLGEPLNLLFWLGCRYAFVSTVLFSLGLLGLAVTRPLRGGVIPAVLIVWMIYLGIGRYFSVPGFFLKDRTGRPRSQRGASTQHISFGCGRGHLAFFHRA
jgi:hypothetical protein